MLHPAFLLAGQVLVVLLAASYQQGGDKPPQVPYLSRDPGAESLAARKAAQMKTAGKVPVYSQFQFTDRIKESGITFVHRIVQDAGPAYKAIHYDHGSGLAVADVDSDGLYDLLFLNQVGGNELWKNLGQGMFKDITAEAGIAAAGRISVAAAFADTDNDGDQDLFVTTVRGGNILFENDGRGRFRDVTASAGLGFTGHSSGAVFFDFNRDGRLDLFVCNVGRYTTDQRGPDGAYVGVRDAFLGHTHADRTEFSILYRNEGQNRFRDVSAEAGLRHAGWSGDATFTDVDGSGWPGLYVLNMQGDDRFYANNQGRFRDSTETHFPKTPWGSMGIKVLDFDNDGALDVFVTDMHSDMWEDVGPGREKTKSRKTPPDEVLQGGANNIFGNALFRNRGQGKFEEVSDRRGVENYWPWGPSVGDINADGWQDIFIASSMNFPFRYGINSMLLNNQGRGFLDSEFLLGIEPRRDGRTTTPWFDVDCSGEGFPRNNLLPLNPCQGRTGRITVTAPLGSRSAAIFDLDNDGDLDIVTSDFHSEPQILISDLAARKSIRWLKVVLEGRASNRDGRGALVRVRAGRRLFVQQNDGKSGYLAQSALPLYFGLGEAPRIDQVEVLWPSGRKQVVTQHLRMNTTLRIQEPQ